MASPTSLRIPLRLLSQQLSAKQITRCLSLQSDTKTPRESAFKPIRTPSRHRAIQTSTPRSPPPSDADPDADSTSTVRLPRAVQAVYLRPLRKAAEYGVPSCDLQIRSYSIRNLEFFSDFAMRAAYYLSLPAYGPVPLPRIVERWTVPRASFVFKKSQENFERKTLRRLIQIKDGHPDTVRMWLAFLKKHQYYGVGMKANVWAYEGLDVAKDMDTELENMKEEADEKWKLIGLKDGSATAEKVMEFIENEEFRAASGTKAPQAKVDHVPI